MHSKAIAFLCVCAIGVAQRGLSAELVKESAPIALPTATLRGSVTMDGGSGQDLDLSRVVAYLGANPELDRVPAAQRRPVMAQQNKKFVGDLLVISRGTTVEFPNRDPFSHNVFSRSRAASFDLDRYPAGQSKSYTFNEPGIVQLFCNIHPEMKATILVVPNRFFARADKSGHFVLDRVPPGSYELVVWQERSDEQHRPIQVAAGGVQEVAVKLQAGARRPAAAPTTPLRSAPAGVERGLSIKRERLNLPVVNEVHPAP